ncbi:Rieske (2Fe-2S) protein [Planctomicrobium sp. SH661]|uniref:Rieske (2Fe-2S) protein n=1 Tax=Planctomicrobium sp. SH661 TaxID=3448124 RepID=UPI003F5C40A4
MWHRVATLEDFPETGAREFVIDGRLVAVFNSDGVLTAMDGICPHAGGPLGEGTVQNGVVTCPWHGWQFNVSTGKHCLSSQIRQACFPVKVEGSEIFVELP